MAMMTMSHAAADALFAIRYFMIPEKPSSIGQLTAKKGAPDHVPERGCSLSCGGWN
jgi:hypothetical protein